ncbi:hypothetical protein LptCag_1437 [Leptospirillum ferriphilum]|uniref:Uncharacterized protein n=1 Tax=Leptospirillum ferriphilum TaxID=178606 RepID=A0A094WDJ9_9BACT|nr:hypothetical protein LptCag_1437 [Leptospirillum ferriphilum]
MHALFTESYPSSFHNPSSDDFRNADRMKEKMSFISSSVSCILPSLDEHKNIPL